MSGQVIFSYRPLSELEGLDDYMRKLLTDAHIKTIGDLQHALMDNKTIYLVGPVRKAHLRNLLHELDLISVLPWTTKLHNVVFNSKTYNTLSVEGEQILVQHLLDWLHHNPNLPRQGHAEPIYVFFGRMGIGRIARKDPGIFGTYANYEVHPNADGRYDDIVKSNGQIAYICNTEPGIISQIYQQCLELLRSSNYKEQIAGIYDRHGEDRTF